MHFGEREKKEPLKNEGGVGKVNGVQLNGHQLGGEHSPVMALKEAVVNHKKPIDRSGEASGSIEHRISANGVMAEDSSAVAEEAERIEIQRRRDQVRETLRDVRKLIEQGKLCL